MDFETKIAIAVAEELLVWQKLNVIAFMTSGILSTAEDDIIGAVYRDGSDQTYSRLCIQPMVILRANREKLPTFLNRANSRGIETAIYIEDMFASGHDAANRETVIQYATEDLPLVGIGLRAEKKVVDKIFKGAKLHD